jgi:hypothetical protein
LSHGEVQNSGVTLKNICLFFFQLMLRSSHLLGHPNKVETLYGGFLSHGATPNHPVVKDD